MRFAVAPFLCMPLLAQPIRAFDCDGDRNEDVLGVSTDCDGNGWPDACDLARRFEVKGTVFEASLLTPFIAEDLDSDGDIDIGVNGALLPNDGAGSFPSVIQASIPMESGRGVLRGDLENDGDTDVLIPVYPAPMSRDANMDLVVVSSDHEVFVFEEGDEGAFTTWRFGTGRAGTLALHDLDLDGDVDMAAGGPEQQVSLYFNGGARSISRVLNRHTGFVSAVLPEDFDGDGDAELALGRPDGGLLVLGNALGPGARDCNANSIPDSCDIAAGVLLDVNGDGLADDCGSIPFKRGDVDMSVEVNITDAIRILSWLFTGGEPLPCHSSADTDDNAAVDLTDAIYLLRFLFLSGDPPLAPFPGCGRDPTLDDLGCRSAKTCPR